MSDLGARAFAVWIVASALAAAACSDDAHGPPMNAAPTAVLVAPTCAAVGDTLDFDGTPSLDPEGPLSELRFLFGDGTPELRTTATRATHAYVEPGRYAVLLRVLDSAGQEGRASASLFVYPRRLCAPTDDCGPGEGCVAGVCRPDSSDGGLCAPSAAPLCDGGPCPIADAGAPGCDGGCDPLDRDAGPPPCDGGTCAGLDAGLPVCDGGACAPNGDAGTNP